jgi:hypothetical protein
MVDKRTKGTRKKAGGVPVAGDSRVAVEWADGETRYIKYTMGAIGTLENCYPQTDENGKFTGSPFTPIGRILKWADPETGMAWSLLSNFLWVGLLSEYPDLTRDEVEDWLDPSQVRYYDVKIGEALKVALGNKELTGIEESDLEDEGKKEQDTGA